MNKVLLTVESSTKTENNNFCNKLVSNETVATAFGKASTRQTFYLFTDQANAKGTTGELDLNGFDIVEKDFTNPEGDSMKLKYLYPKR